MNRLILMAAAGFMFCTMETLILPVQAAALEEVVVTARKRAETFVDVPVSVNVFTESDIESAGIERPHDFIALTPNVTLVQTQNAGNSFINIRGVSQARNSEMSAAVLVDGVLMSNPAQFNQELFDIQQIEVLRGPQGALYGRNAIGGAITITTKQPTDEYEGKITAGYDSGPGYKVQGVFSGPITDTLKFRASASYKNTDGYLYNPFLDEEPDPYEDISGRLKLLWEPTDDFTADLRVSVSQMDTQALYFTIGPDADNTTIPIRVNNPGTNERDMYNLSLKMDYDTDYGTFTSITSYDDLEELLTGDQFNFVPRPESFAEFAANFPVLAGDPGGFFAFMKGLTGDQFIDMSQTQFLDVQAWSQEFRFTSPAENRFRWIVGAYMIGTDRYISTGNQVDRGNGVFPVFRTPRPSVFVDPTDPSPQIGLLEDAQDNFAWALFGEIAYDISEDLEASFSLRYDKDTRENTTLTQPLYDPTGLGLVPGTSRKESWDDLQPKISLRWNLRDNLTLYSSYSRGFRSGGFNQTGVGGAVPEPGVNDLFEQQTSDTFEMGAKAQFFDNRLKTSLSVYHTEFTNAYFFFFDPGTSTQNLGGIPEVEYRGLEFEADAVMTDYLSVYAGLGYTDSTIKQAADPADVGNEAPLVSEYTLNVGALLQYPLTMVDTGMFGNVNFVARADYQIIGKTYWDPGNISTRSPVNLLDVRAGFMVEDNWSLMFWSRNAAAESYNAEFSPGPAPGAHFLFRAPPRHWGVEFTKRF
ncbi:MAG: TonB-dependent receptor [Gammaproteobacteria bacterium]